jgi:hypothetical protein
MAKEQVKSNQKLEAALLYASWGWSVIPLHSIRNGQCTCKKGAECGHSSGKHPRIEWAEFQTRRATVEEIKAWWKKWPDANVGVITGAVSGIIVLDVDEPRGIDTLRGHRLAVPLTVRQQTGGGGYQYIFKYPGFECQNFAGKVGHTILPNVDFRGDGGLVVLPPSNHLSGKCYEWIKTPDEEQIVDSPSWLLDMIRAQSNGHDGQGKKLTPKDWHRVVPEGQRNTELARKAGYLLRSMSVVDALPMLSAWNLKWCNPPLEEAELRTIVESIGKKEAGKQNKGKVLPMTRAGKETSSAEAVPEGEDDTSLEEKIDNLQVNPVSSEAIVQVKYFVLHDLIHFDELKVQRILKDQLKKKFSLGADEIKSIFKAWKEERAQKQAESRALENTKEELNHYISNPVFERDGRIWKIKIKERFGEKIHEEVPITTFTIEPIESITIKGEGETLSVNFKAGYKEFKKVLLSPGCWSSTQKFMNVLPGKETVFAGSTIDVQYIRFLMSTLEMSHKIGIRISGFHDGQFITEEGALSIQGISEGIVYFNEVPTNCKLLSMESATADELSGIKKYIANFNTPTVSLPILGWITACFLKSITSEILDEIGLSNGFPLLNIQGEAGAGKTQSAEAVIMRMWAIQGEPRSIGELTKFTMMKLVDGSNTIPVILEENKACMQTDYFQNLISNLIRSIYNCLEGGRGRADQSTQVYRYQAPVVIVGETGFTESALLDRFVTVFLSKKDSSPYLQNFKELRKQPLEKLGRSILEKALRMDREEVKRILEEELEAIDSELEDRPRTNAAVVRFGLLVLGAVLGIEFDLSKVDEAVKEGIKEGDSTHRKSAVDKILEAMCLMSAFQEKIVVFKDTGREEKVYKYQDHLEEGVDFDIIRDPGLPILKLHISNAYSVFKKWARSYKFEGDLLPQINFSKQLGKEPYCLSIGSVRIGGESVRGATMDINKMRNKGLELSKFWGVDPNEAPF